jgi:hypothetical protein
VTHTHDRVLARNGRGGSGTPGKQTPDTYPADFAAPACACGAVREDAQIGLERSPDCLGWARQEPPREACCWICAMRAVFREVWRVLTPTGTLWCNVGDSMARSGAAPPRRDHSMGQSLGTYGRQGYSAASAMPARAPGPLPEKNLLGLPWRLALALQADGWILRSAITWCKAAPMPESAQDRPTRATEMLFLFAKQPHYFYDATAVRVTTGNGWHGSSFTSAHDVATKAGLGQQARQEAPGRNLWDYWVLGPEPSSFQHYAAFPTELVRKCLLAGAPRAVCSACGKPHVRQVERHYVKSPVHGAGSQMRGRSEDTAINGWAGMPRVALDVHTTGFSPSCACAAPTRLSVILDPFAGSGTVGLVARELGHDAVCLDLSMPYLRDIARERLGLAALSRWTEGAAPRPETHTDLPLFAPLDTNASPLLC